MADNSYITFDLFKQFEEIICTFSTRKGGYSTGPFTSQNMGNVQHDKSEVVKRNRLNYYKNLNIDPTKVILPGQIHSANITVVNSGGQAGNSDALISNKFNLFLGIQTADCFPIFLYEPGNRVIGAIHAGWQGAIAGIIPKTIALMETRLGANPSDIFAAIGPGLQKDCFEVREDVYHQFSEMYWHSHPDRTKRYLDLQAFIRDCLIKTGLQRQNIESDNSCTRCRVDLYYSYRRDGEKSGRMMGLLGIHT